MGIITTLSATGMAAGLAFTGVSAAGADVTLPAGGVLEQRVTKFCGRVPNLLERVDRAQARITGDAGTPGSLARLKARQAKAESGDRQRVAKRLGNRLDRRTERLAKLPGLKKKLTAAQTECVTLELPAPSGS